MIIATIVIMVWTLVVGAGVAMTCKKEFDESLCEVLNAIFNVDEIKDKARKAAENGEKYIEI